MRTQNLLDDEWFVSDLAWQVQHNWGRAGWFIRKFRVEQKNAAFFCEWQIAVETVSQDLKRQREDGEERAREALERDDDLLDIVQQNERDRASRLLETAMAARPQALDTERVHRQRAAETAVAAAEAAPRSAAADPSSLTTVEVASKNAQAAHRAERAELARVDVRIAEAQGRADRASGRWAALLDTANGLDARGAAAPANTRTAAGLVLVVFVVALVLGIHIAYHERDCTRCRAEGRCGHADRARLGRGRRARRRARTVSDSDQVDSD